MRKQIAAANWKMNLTLQQGNELLDEIINKNISLSEDQQTVFGVPFPYLLSAKNKTKDSKNFFIAAQNCYIKESGAFTGEVSATMLSSCETDYVIIGHSERRREHGESLEIINQKIKLAAEAGLQPIVCISNEDELQALTEVGVKAAHWIVAFEPLEAIGSGKPSDPEMVASMVKKIKKQLKGCRVLYGGSVDLENIKTYLAVSDGSLVGGASLDPRNFLDLCTIASGN